MYAAHQPWEITELQLDEPRDHEVLVRCEVSGMCHSDDHVRTGDMPVRFPIVGGHEGAGVVEAVGPLVDRSRWATGSSAPSSLSAASAAPARPGRRTSATAARYARTGAAARRHLPLPRGRRRTWARCAPSAPSPSARSSTSRLREVRPTTSRSRSPRSSAAACRTGWGSAMNAAAVRAGRDRRRLRRRRCRHQRRPGCRLRGRSGRRRGRPGRVQAREGAGVRGHPRLRRARDEAPSSSRA